MKFIIRDDDVNYFYTREQLFQWFEGIWEICPISLCVIPYVKGHFFRWCNPSTSGDRQAFYNDDGIYPIGDNKELVTAINEWICEDKVSVSMHGIYHRNPDQNAPEVKNNYITGAELYTDKDISNDIVTARLYLRSLFRSCINTFSAPQNMISRDGFRSLIKVGMNICTDLPSLRDIGTYWQIIGVDNYLKLLLYRMSKSNYKKVYPFLLKSKESSIVSHFRLQPVTHINSLYEEIDRVYNQKGIFILSTHSYGFDMNMKDDSRSMKEVLIEILQYVSKFPDVEFTTLEKLFD